MTLPEWIVQTIATAIILADLAALLVADYQAQRVKAKNAPKTPIVRFYGKLLR